MNPTFGWAGSAIDGADADVILDETLIEIKTTKHLKLDRMTYNQLWGYYFLSCICKPDGVKRKLRVKELAVYFARYAKLVTMKVDNILPPKLRNECLKQFREMIIDFA